MSDEVKESKRRRSSGEGSIYKRGDGKWVGAMTLTNGRRRVFYGATQREVKKKLDAAKHLREQGLPIPPQRLTLAVIIDEWIENDLKQRPVTRTLESYEALISLHIKPALGKKRLAELTVGDVEGFLREKAEVKSARGTPYSASTLRSLRAVLSGALTYAQRLDYVHRNVARVARVPAAPPPRERTALTPKLARLFLDKIQGHRLEALYSVAMALGLRQGEALGLRWSDIDFNRRVVHVRVQLTRIDGQYQLRPPKRHQIRNIPLPECAVMALREHRRRQVAERLAAGERWQEQDLVFPSEVGTPLNRHNVTHRFKALVERLGLPEMVFHELRHTCASLLLAQGVHPLTVMEILGHTELSTTTGVYAHVDAEVKAEAARRMDVALASGE